jgi:thiol-disulfide isomerase/thioredoxin/outer membrane lipoprotein-sorting protein
MNAMKTLAALAVVLTLVCMVRAQQPNVELQLIPRPPDGQANQAATKPAQVSPEASAVIKKVADAYTKLKSLDLVGKLTGELDIGGQKKDEKAEFTSSFAAPNSFKHEIKDEELVGSTGEKLYVYGKGTNMYLMVDAPKGKVLSADLPDPFPDLIGGQNVSLVLALSIDPSAELTKAYSVVNKKDDVKIDDKAYTALELKEPKAGPSATVLIDPETNLIRRAVLDFSADAIAKGAQDVKKALVTIDYVKTTPNPATQPTQFAWVPPAGAKDMAKQDESGGDAPAMALKGKPAPAVKLKGLDDKEVSLADLKGSVVVLDFWATWCGPCVGSLPHLDKLYQDKKADGVKVFAVNQREDKELVAGFMKSKNLSVPVLLDSEGKAGDEYKANAIPETVVVGKDGVVKEVFIGAGPGTEKELHEAVEKAMKEAK